MTYLLSEEEYKALLARAEGTTVNATYAKEVKAWATAFMEQFAKEGHRYFDAGGWFRAHPFPEPPAQKV